MKRRDDEGAVLIMVLIAVSVIAVVLGALLSYADTNLRATVALQDVASTNTDAEGAVQAAVNNIRNGTSTSGNCLGSTHTLSLPSFDGTTSAAVTCTSDPSSAVRIQCPSLSNCNRPGNAILTLGTIAGEDGLQITQPNTSTFKVHGSIYSNSNINVIKGSLTTNNAVYAKGACTGSIQSTPAPSCSSSASNPLSADPGYAANLSTIPAHQSLPDCSKKNSVLTFSPGYYDDAVALSTMMTKSSPCSGSLWWFQPGNYYFDFHNTNGTNSNPLINPGSNIWTINDGTLVAGTPTGTLSASTTIPGACVNPIDSKTASGVQFIFGGDSQMVVKAGQAEICGGWQPDGATFDYTKPPVAVYGLTSGGTESVTSKTFTMTGTPTGDFTGATATNLATVDGTAATFTSPKNNTTATLGGTIVPTTAIPSGSILQSATLRVVHRHSTGSGTDPLTVTLTPSGGAGVSANLTGAAGSTTAWKKDESSLLNTTPGQLADQIYRNGLSGLQVALSTGQMAKNDIESIDAIQLDLTYVAPVLRAETGCVTTGPYTGGSSSSCAVITTTNSPGSQFYVQGTTYTPKAALDISLNNLSEQVFRFGVISRSLQIKQTGSFAYIGAVIEVPDDAPGFAYAVYLTAYVCPAASTCGTTGSPVLRAKVAIVDANPAAPTAGKRQIAILNWTPTG